MIFSFNQHVELVKGKKKSLIVNISNKSYMVISKKFYKILKKCKDGKKIEKITNNFNYLQKLLFILEQNDYGKFLEREAKTIVKKISLRPQKSQLDMIWLPITENCNYKCVHCYENAKLSIKKTKQIGIKDYKIFFDKIDKKFSINCVQITGGEPLLRGYEFLESLLRLLKTYNISTIEVFSNLSLLDETFVYLFKKYDVKIATSFYSCNPDIHDSITNVKGSQMTTLKKLDILKENNISFRIAIVLLKQNKMEKDSLRNWLNLRYNLHDVKKYDIIRPIGRGNNIENVPIELFNEQYKDSIKHIPHFAYNFFYNNQIYNSCWGNKVCLKSNGKIYPCVMAKICLGNFKNIIKILNNKNSYRYLSKDKINTCKICEFRYLCMECRAMYAISKKQLKNKPYLCSYNPHKAIFIKENNNDKIK